MYCLSIGTVLVLFLDWLGEYGYISMNVSKYSRAVILFVFLSYYFKTGIRCSKYEFRFGNVLFYFVILNIVYSLFSDSIISNLYVTSRIAFWVIASVVAYRLILSGKLSMKIIRNTVFATVAIGAIFTIHLMINLETETQQNASAYLLLWCLPLLLLLKKSHLVNGFIGLSIVAILLTVKRGAMIALGISLAAYVLTYLKINTNFRSFKTIVGLLLIAGVTGIYALMSKWVFVQTRFEDTSGSGRDNMYNLLIGRYIDSEPLNLVFGFGIGSVQEYTYSLWGASVYAHSDWLQFVPDFGFFGILFMVWLHIRFLDLIREFYIKRHPYTPSLVMGYTIMFLVNIYSGHFLAPVVLYLGLIFAISSAAAIQNI